MRSSRMNSQTLTHELSALPSPPKAPFEDKFDIYNWKQLPRAGAKPVVVVRAGAANAHVVRGLSEAQRPPRTIALHVLPHFMPVTSSPTPYFNRRDGK